MGSLRTELHIPSIYHTVHSAEDCAESDDGAGEVEGEDDMLLGCTPSDSLQVNSALPCCPQLVSQLPYQF